MTWFYPQEPDMRNQDPKGAAARRRAASERLRKLFAELTAQLAAGTAEIWSKVEERLGPGATPEATGAPPPYSTQPMQQQPVQQQQAKSEPAGEKKP